jgi:hypothetical protein
MDSGEDGAAAEMKWGCGQRAAVDEGAAAGLVPSIAAAQAAPWRKAEDMTSGGGVEAWMVWSAWIADAAIVPGSWMVSWKALR